MALAAILLHHLSSTGSQLAKIPIMARALAVAAVASLLLLHASPCAAARPMSTTPASPGTSTLAVPPASSAEGAQWRAGADAAARAGKWLPYPYAGGGVHRFPGYPRYFTGYPEGKPMMWAGGAPPSLGLGAYGGQLGKSAAPYGGDETRQEQVAMWASLLNPQRPATPTTSWLPANGADEPADQARDEPKALDGAAEGAEMDLPPGGGGVHTGGQPKWGLYPGNNNGK